MNVFFLLALYFPKHRSDDSTLFFFFFSFNWGNFAGIVRDNCVFHQLNFPFLLEAAAAFLLLEADEPGNSLMSSKHVGVTLRWQMQTLLLASQYSPRVPAHRAKFGAEKGNSGPSDLCNRLVRRPADPDWAVLSSAWLVPWIFFSIALSTAEQTLGNDGRSVGSGVALAPQPWRWSRDQTAFRRSRSGAELALAVQSKKDHLRVNLDLPVSKHPNLCELPGTRHQILTDV